MDSTELYLSSNDGNQDTKDYLMAKNNVGEGDVSKSKGHSTLEDKKEDERPLTNRVSQVST